MITQARKGRREGRREPVGRRDEKAKMRGNPLFVQKAECPRTPSGKNSNWLAVGQGRCRDFDCNCAHAFNPKMHVQSLFNEDAC